MTGPTHALVGLATTIGTGHITGFLPNAFGFIAMIIGSLAPDIEGGGSISKPGKIFEPFLGRKVGKLLDFIVSLFGEILKSIFGHRGFIHSPIIPVVMFVTAKIINSQLLFWFAWGYIWHIIADYCTKEGVPLLSPLKTKKYSASGMKTGSRAEKIIAIFLLFFVIIFGWPLLPEHIKSVHQEVLNFISNR